MKSRLIHLLDLPYSLAVLLFGCWYVWLGIDDWRDLYTLRDHGVRAEGRLQNATINRYAFIYKTYELNIAYLDRHKSFRADKALYGRYVRDGQFRDNTPVEILYLPGHPHTAILPDMIGSKQHILLLFIFGGFWVWIGAIWLGKRIGKIRDGA